MIKTTEYEERVRAHTYWVDVPRIYLSKDEKKKKLSRGVNNRTG